MKRIVLSLALITGISLAETTENLFDDPFNDFLDGKYEYPNIHMHGDGSYDPYIYTGASLNYTDSAVAEHEINLDKLTYEITKVNYGYKYFSYAPGEVAVAIALIDEDGSMIDDAVMEYNITTNQWISIDRVYNDMEKLSRAKELWMGIAGSSDWNGTDDIRIGDIYMTYDYQEIPLDLITDPVYDIAKVTDIKYDLDANGVPKIEEIKIEEIKVEEVKIDVPENSPVVSQPVSVAQQQPSQTSTKTQRQTDKKETKQVSKKETKQTKKEVKKNNEVQTQTAMRTVELVQTASNSIPTISTESLFVGGSIGVDVLASDGVDLVDTIQITEMSFYEDKDIYEDQINLADTLQFNKPQFYGETDWYGSNTKFY